MAQITTAQAINLNNRIASIINRPNPLCLSASGMPENGIELSQVVISSLRNIQAMAQRSIDAGRATKQALDLLAKVESVFAEYGIK
ncbi:MAG: hypothetical protein RBS34_11645 [Desulfofustis sp.]|jgi:hypothetical protein|nr:hypothetical protein [Desulfofustis sp.]